MTEMGRVSCGGDILRNMGSIVGDGRSIDTTASS